MKTILFSTFYLLTVCNALSQANQSPATARLRWSARIAQDLHSQPTLQAVPGLAPADREALSAKIASLIRPFMKDYDLASERELRSVVAGTRILLIDLDQDGVPEVMAHAFGIKEGCGATGNCPLWIFKKTSDDYAMLLDTRDKDGIGGIQSITIEETRTNGFLDLILAAHDSATEKDLYVYRFSRGSYREGACYVANWLPRVDHPALKNPLITPCK